MKRQIANIVSLSRLVVVATICMVCGGCYDRDKPFPIHSQEFLSPDGKWVATVELVDNGLGFGQGVLYEEVHLTEPDEPVGEHARMDSTAIFYVESGDDHGGEVSVKWLDANKLTVYSVAKSRPGRMATEYRGVKVNYVLANAPPSGDGQVPGDEGQRK